MGISTTSFEAPFRSATGAPLSPLQPRVASSLGQQAAEVRSASTYASRASRDSPTPQWHPQFSATLHTKLAIDGLLPDAPAPQPPAAQTSKPQPPSAPSEQQRRPSLFSTLGKSSGIGALLGELDVRRESLADMRSDCSDDARS